MSNVTLPSKELVCAVCAEPWALGHRCKPTPIPAAGQCGKRCGFDIKTGRLATIDPECHVHGGPQPTASNQMAIEVREAFAESARMAHGTGHYDDCWKDHWPCVLERLLSEIGRLQRELEGRHTLDCDLAKHRNCTRCSCKSESLSGGNPGEKSVSRPADHRGIVAARSSEGGIVGQNPGETIQSCELVDSNPVPVGRASPEQLHAKDVDPSPSIAAHEPPVLPKFERYDLQNISLGYEAHMEMVREDCGDWVRWDDIAPHLRGALPPLPEWQPIESAPKEGKAFLVFCPAHFNQYLVYRRTGEFFHWSPPSYPLREQPSHWRALPDDPSTLTKCEGQS